MKPSVVQGVAQLEGWVLEKEPNASGFGEEEPSAIWTAYELADHREACEMVREIGDIADVCCVAPEIDIRRNLLYVTATTDGGLTEEDVVFAQAMDREIGNGQKQKTLLGDR